MKKIIVITIMLSLLLGILPAQMAEGAARTAGKPEARMNPMQKCMDEMKLTDAQMEKFATAKSQYEKQSNSLNAEIKNLNIDLIEAIKAENLKRAKELNKQISDKDLALKNARIDMMANILKELTKEQKELWKKNAGMMMGGMGMGMQQGQGPKWQNPQGAKNFKNQQYDKKDRKARMKDCGNQ